MILQGQEQRRVRAEETSHRGQRSASNRHRRTLMRGSEKYNTHSSINYVLGTTTTQSLIQVRRSESQPLGTMSYLLDDNTT